MEYWRDVRPILDRSCVACHTKEWEKPAGGLVLDADDERIVGHRFFPGEAPGTYFRLALDGPIKAYENRFAGPRAFVAGRIQVEPNPDAALGLL